MYRSTQGTDLRGLFHTLVVPLRKEERFMAFPGYATPEGTARYAARLQGTVAQEHFREFQGLKISSIGLGTYLGEHDVSTDAQYRDAIIRAVELGCNLSIIHQLSLSTKRAHDRTGVGHALREDECIAMSWSSPPRGFLPFDGVLRDRSKNFRLCRKTFIQPGISQPIPLRMSPHDASVSSTSTGTSLHNLGLECVDIYFVHNPETQLEEVPRVEFVAHACAFQARGKRRCRHAALVWHSHLGRIPSTTGRHGLSGPGELVATGTLGVKSTFRAIQPPHNLAMPEALTNKTSRSMDDAVTVRYAGIWDLCDVQPSILQSRLTVGCLMSGRRFSNLTPLPSVPSNSCSSPGVGSALIGMKQVRHVEENLAVAKVPPASLEQFMQLFERSS
jgi:hypothetical protein